MSAALSGQPPSAARRPARRRRSGLADIAVPARTLRRRRVRRVRWAPLASLLLHGALVAAFLSLHGARPLAPVETTGIEVEIVSAVPPSTAVVPGPPGPTPAVPDRPDPPPQPAPPARQAPPDPQASTMVTARRILSQDILADPVNRETRQALASLMADEQMIQLCSLEAMEQVAAWQPAFQPELLVAYAMAETRLEADALLADGGAFYSKGKWYNIKFKCDLTADHQQVAAFAFQVGEAIPRGEWEAHDLPDGGGLDE